MLWRDFFKAMRVYDHCWVIDLASYGSPYLRRFGRNQDLFDQDTILKSIPHEDDILRVGSLLEMAGFTTPEFRHSLGITSPREPSVTYRNRCLQRK